MKKILAIAALAMKSAIRSRLFVVLMFLLLVVIVWLPFSIKGDGTLNGQVALLLYYSLGICGLILGIATVWISCWSIAKEIDEKQIQMITVKPVYKFEIWLGKWVGLMLMNAILLCVTGGAIYIAVMLKVKYSDAGAKERTILSEEILNSRKLLTPDRDDISDAAHQLMGELIETGAIESDTPHDEAYQIAYKRLLAQRAVVAPGNTKTWVFDIDHAAIKSGSYITLRYHLSAYARNRNPVTGVWEAGTVENPQLYKFHIENYLHGRHMFEVPASIIPKSGKLVVTFRNADREKSNVAVFGMEKDVELLVREGSFEANYVKSLVIMFCNLALLAALGLTASALFSFPVASFAVVSLITMSLLAHYFSVTGEEGSASGGCGHDHDRIPSFIERAGGIMTMRMNAVFDPAWKYAPLGRLTDGLLIEWRFAGSAILVLVLIYPGILGCICSYFLRKRELALPMKGM